MTSADKFLNAVSGFIADYGMLSPGDKVLCAVSGGADSMCMLSAMSELGYGVECAHFNHKLRGGESDRDEAFVRDYCEKHGIFVHCGSGDVSQYARDNKTGIEAAARILRYEFLDDAANMANAGKIATAHNSGDNAETILLNLARGSGMRGLTGIPPVRGRIVRPMLSVSRDEIESYMRDMGIPHIEDSTNASMDYSRNKLRLLVMPVLRELNPAFEEAALSASRLLREDGEYLDALADEFIRNNIENGTLSAGEIASLPKPVASRVIRRFLDKPLSRVHTEAALELCRGDSARAYADLNGLRIAVEYGRLFVNNGDTPVIQRKTIAPGDDIILEGTDIRITCEFIPHCRYINNSLNIFFFKNDTIYGKMSIRPKMSGDEIRIFGRDCTKSLKKLFSESRIPISKRGLIPVIADSLGIIAVCGFGIAERCAPSQGDDVIKIEITQR